jgi:hypothetical protein
MACRCDGLQPGGFERAPIASESAIVAVADVSSPRDWLDNALQIGHHALSMRMKFDWFVEDAGREDAPAPIGLGSINRRLWSSGNYEPRGERPTLMTRACAALF